MKIKKLLRLRRFNGSRIPVGELLQTLLYLPGHCQAVCSCWPCGEFTGSDDRAYCYYHTEMLAGKLQPAIIGVTKIGKQRF